MRYNIKNNKGNVLVILGFMWMFIIFIVGMCVDGSFVMYYQSRLMAATKIAAVSTSTHYNINKKGKIIINGTDNDALEALNANYKDAQLDGSAQIAGNTCTIKTKANVDFIFMKILGINSTTIYESYKATRN